MILACDEQASRHKGKISRPSSLVYPAILLGDQETILDEMYSGALLRRPLLLDCDILPSCNITPMWSNSR
jgi:hypothetical protein